MHYVLGVDNYTEEPRTDAETTELLIIVFTSNRQMQLQLQASTSYRLHE